MESQVLAQTLCHSCRLYFLKFKKSVLYLCPDEKSRFSCLKFRIGRMEVSKLFWACSEMATRVDGIRWMNQEKNQVASNRAKSARWIWIDDVTRKRGGEGRDCFESHIGVYWISSFRLTTQSSTETVQITSWFFTSLYKMYFMHITFLFLLGSVLNDMIA